MSTPTKRADNPGGATDNYRLPWPPSTAPADPPEDFEALATASDAAVMTARQELLNRMQTERGEIDAGFANHEGRIAHNEWYNEALDWRLAVSENRVTNLEAWSGPIDDQVYRALPAQIAQRELQTQYIYHEVREHFDLPQNPVNGQRVVVVLDPSTFNTGAGGQQANSPTWELRYDGWVWKVIAATPMVAWAPWLSGPLPGTGLWEPVGGPEVFNPYKYMRCAVRHGATLIVDGGTYVLSLAMTPDVSQSAATGHWPAITAGVSVSSVTMSGQAIAIGWDPNVDYQVTTFASAPVGSQYEHSNRWLEVMPIEVGIPGIHGPEAEVDATGSSEFPPGLEPPEATGPPGELAPWPTEPRPEYADHNHWPPIRRAPEQHPMVLPPPPKELKAPPPAPREWSEQRKKELENGGPGPDPTA